MVEGVVGNIDFRLRLKGGKEMQSMGLTID